MVSPVPVTLARPLNYLGSWKHAPVNHSMLQGLFQSRNPKAARELFKDMQAKGLTPTVFTYHILFHGICKNSQCSEALALFQSFGNKEVMKDVGLYNILIDGCSKCGKPNLAMDLFDELILKGLKVETRC